MAREGVLEPRYRLAKVGSGSSLVDVVVGLGEFTTVSGTRYPYAISARTFSYYSGSAWTFGSYATQPTSDAPSGANTDYIDSVVIYDPVSDENAVAWVNGVNQAFQWGPSSNTFSTMTNAPIARAIAAYDSRVVFGNITSAGTRLVQRIQYSEKFQPSITTAPTGGFDDLMDARGGIQRMLSDGERLLVFFDHEVWFGYPIDFPFNLAYRPLDRTRGTVSPWTVCQTPKGVFFLGDNYQPYIIPPGGVPQPVGLATWKTLREEIDVPSRAGAEYNPDTGRVLLVFPIQGGTGRPTKGLELDLDTGTWAPQTFDVNLTRIAVGDVTSSAITWGGLVGAWNAQTLTWTQLGGTSSKRAIYAGTSTGTVAVFTSTATGDLGPAVLSETLMVVPNEDPTRKLYVREVRLDYQSNSASSVTLRLSNDFGQTYQQSVGVALPVAPLSAQTSVFVGVEAQYPCLQFQHDQGHRFALQRVTAVVSPLGRG
jgi:hypothetical protein